MSIVTDTQTTHHKHDQSSCVPSYPLDNITHDLLLQKFAETEQALHQSNSLNRELEEQVQRSRRNDAHSQDAMETKQLEIASLKKALKDLEQRAKVGGVTVGS